MTNGDEIYTNNNDFPIVIPSIGAPVRSMAFPDLKVAARLYAVHRARCAGGMQYRPPVDDPHAYVLAKEQRALDHHVACGYYFRSEDGRRLLPTWTGAFLMTWKSLPPVPLVRRAANRWRAGLALRGLGLEEYGSLPDAELDGGFSNKAGRSASPAGQDDRSEWLG